MKASNSPALMGRAGLARRRRSSSGGWDNRDRRHGQPCAERAGPAFAAVGGSVDAAMGEGGVDGAAAPWVDRECRDTPLGEAATGSAYA